MTKPLLNSAPSRKNKLIFLTVLWLFSLASIYGFGRLGLQAVSYAFVLYLTLYVFRRLSNKLFIGYLILTFCLSFLYLPHAINYGELTIGILASVLETNSNEAVEYLINTPIFSYVASIGYLLLFLAILKLNNTQPKKLPKFQRKTQQYLFYFACLLVLLSMVQKPLYSYIKYDTEERQQMGWKILSKTKSYPIKFVIDFFWLRQDYYQQKTKLDRAKLQTPTWQIIRSAPKYKNYVLIIGESMRKDYMSVYGYPLATTPFLQSTPAIIFDDYIAPASHTTTSLQRQLFQQQNYQNLNYANTVISLANMAGMDTYWLSNQGAMGEYDTLASSISIKADKRYFTKAGGYNSDNISDLALLGELQKIVDDNEIISKNGNISSTNNNHNRLIVMHLLGSHPKFCNRLDKAYQIDNVQGFLNSNMSCYLSSIRQTDKLLEQVYEILQKNEQQNAKQNNEQNNKQSEKPSDRQSISGFSMLYFSDHGLSHRNRDNHFYKPTTLLHGDNFKQNYQVPLIIISSDNTQVQRITDKRSGFDLMVGLAEWLGIEEKTLSQQNSFLGTDFKNSESSQPRKVFANGNIIDYADLADDPAILP